MATDREIGMLVDYIGNSSEARRNRQARVLTVPQKIANRLSVLAQP